MCYHIEQRETTVSVVVSETSQAVAAASPTGQDTIARLLSETGQQSVADVVRHALHTADQTGQNPLQQSCEPAQLL